MMNRYIAVLELMNHETGEFEYEGLYTCDNEKQDDKIIKAFLDMQYLEDVADDDVRITYVGTEHVTVI
jgi:hypothetical protein